MIIKVLLLLILIGLTKIVKSNLVLFIIFKSLFAQFGYKDLNLKFRFK